MSCSESYMPLGQRPGDFSKLVDNKVCLRYYNADSGIGMVDGILIFGFFHFLLVLIGNRGFGASPLRTTVCRLPGSFFSFASHFLVFLMKNHQIYCFGPKATFKKKKGPCQDDYKQSSGVGMHQNPSFRARWTIIDFLTAAPDFLF